MAVAGGHEHDCVLTDPHPGLEHRHNTVRHQRGAGVIHMTGDEGKDVSKSQSMQSFPCNALFETPLHNSSRSGLYGRTDTSYLANTAEHQFGKPANPTVPGYQPNTGDPKSQSDRTNCVDTVNPNPRDPLATVDSLRSVLDKTNAPGKTLHDANEINVVDHRASFGIESI